MRSPLIRASLGAKALRRSRPIWKQLLNAAEFRGKPQAWRPAAIPATARRQVASPQRAAALWASGDPTTPTRQRTPLTVPAARWSQARARSAAQARAPAPPGRVSPEPLAQPAVQ